MDVGSQPLRLTLAIILSWATVGEQYIELRDTSAESLPSGPDKLEIHSTSPRSAPGSALLAFIVSGLVARNRFG